VIKAEIPALRAFGAISQQIAATRSLRRIAAQSTPAFSAGTPKFLKKISFIF